MENMEAEFIWGLWSLPLVSKKEARDPNRSLPYMLPEAHNPKPLILDPKSRNPTLVILNPKPPSPTPHNLLSLCLQDAGHRAKLPTAVPGAIDARITKLEEPRGTV